MYLHSVCWVMVDDRYSSVYFAWGLSVLLFHTVHLIGCVVQHSSKCAMLGQILMTTNSLQAYRLLNHSVQHLFPSSLRNSRHAASH